MNVNFKANLTKDAKINTLKSGNSVMLLQVAENFNKKDQNGTWQRIGAAFRYCVAYNDTIKAMANELKKGTLVEISGFTALLPKTDKYPEREQIIVQELKIVPSHQQAVPEVSDDMLLPDSTAGMNALSR